MQLKEQSTDLEAAQAAAKAAMEESAKVQEEAAAAKASTQGEIERLTQQLEESLSQQDVASGVEEALRKAQSELEACRKEMEEQVRAG
jgi:hypothetical protein